MKYCSTFIKKNSLLPHTYKYEQVLVVDSLGKKIISTCLKMKDMLDNGITIIEVRGSSCPSTGVVSQVLNNQLF